MKERCRPFVALGRRLQGIPEVITLGVRPNFLEYSSRERKLISDSEIVLYPTLNYAQFLTTIGKPIFPSLENHLYADEKIMQTTLFNMLDIAHPRTKFFFHLHHKDILTDFNFPFVAKLPRASSQGRGVFLINDDDQLRRYLGLTKVAYIQEYIPHDRDLRVVLINYRPIIAYWRKRRPDNFRTNLFQGGSIHFDNIPDEALNLASKLARKCRFNDAGLDFIHYEGQWYLIEANMKYGLRGLKMKGLNLKEILRQKLLSGELLCLEI